MATEASGKSIILVEDDAGLSLLVRRRLESDGHQIACAQSGQIARGLICENEFDLMLIDYELGDMLADEFISDLHSREIFIPFIVMTGQGSEKVAVEMMKLGAIDYVSKNISFIELVPTVVRAAFEKMVIQNRLIQAEDALKKEQTHLLNNIPDMVFQLDSEDRLVTVNPASGNILGLSCQEMLGSKLANFLHKHDVRHVMNDLQAVRDGQKIMRHPIRFVHQDGSICWLEGNLVAVYDEDGNYSGISAIYQDITQQKMYDDELKRAQVKIRLISDTSPSITLELDTDFKIVSINKAGCNFFSFTDNNQFIGNLCTVLFEYSWHDVVSDAMSGAMAGHDREITVQMADSTGVLKWFDMVFSPLKSMENRVFSIIATGWDVSGRVSREIDIRKSLEREERLAHEAAVLQSVSLSAGEGVEVDPVNVVRTVTEELVEYVRCGGGFGYFFSQSGSAECVRQSGDISGQIKKSFNKLLSQSAVFEAIWRMRTPKALLNTSVYALLKEAGFAQELLSSTVIIPLVNAGNNYGFLVLVGLDKDKSQSHMGFFKSVGNCAGLAIANAQAIKSASSGLKSRMLQLENFSKVGLSASGRKQLGKSLETILESGVELIRAESAMVLLLNKPAAILYCACGHGINEEGFNSVVLQGSECLAWKSIKQKVPMFCDDITRQDVMVSEDLANLTEKTAMFIPLIDKDECIGVMVFIDQATAYDISHVHVLEAFAGLGVQAVSNARLADKATELDQRLSEIRKVSRTITSSKDVVSVLNQVCLGAVEVLHAEMAWIGMISRDLEDVKYTTHAGRGFDHLKRLDIAYGDSVTSSGPTGTAIKTGKPVIVNNIADDELLRSLCVTRGFKSCCAVPIVSKTEVLGALTLYHSESDIFTEQNLAVVEEFSDQASMAILLKLRLEKLLESETLKNITLESVNEAIFVLDFSGAVITANKAAEKLFDTNSADLKKCHYSELFSISNLISDMTERWICTRQASESASGWVELNSGRKIFVSVESNSVAVEDTPCLHLTVTDLTMQKKMNASLEHAEKLTKVGQIATQMAHEIGNPLSLISSQIQRMVMDQQPDLEKLEGLLGHIDRISGLIRRFSNLGTTRHLSVSLEMMAPVIEDILGLVEFSKPFKGIKIEKHIEAALPRVNIDKNKITQVLLNLLLNAADACHGSGVIKITAKQQIIPIEINNEKTDAEYLLVSINDSGTGIDEETLQHIFEPFFTNKEVGKGTGLGLSVSLSIIDQHQGWIYVETEPGQGSTFTVYLPIKPAEQGKNGIEIRSIGDSAVENIHNKVI